MHPSIYLRVVLFFRRQLVCCLHALHIERASHLALKLRSPPNLDRVLGFLNIPSSLASLHYPNCRLCRSTFLVNNFYHTPELPSGQSKSQYGWFHPLRFFQRSGTYYHPHAVSCFTLVACCASFNRPKSAIIKAHAIKNRFDIESRISSAGFEIIKERQIAFHEEDDGVRGLFGPDAAPSLCGCVGLQTSGPLSDFCLNRCTEYSDSVWIYVLERRRAVEVWRSLMGDEGEGAAILVCPPQRRSYTSLRCTRLVAPESLESPHARPATYRDPLTRALTESCFLDYRP